VNGQVASIPARRSTASPARSCAAHNRVPAQKPDTHFDWAAGTRVGDGRGTEADTCVTRKSGHLTRVNTRPQHVQEAPTSAFEKVTRSS
jgi:hypothetical protein